MDWNTCLNCGKTMDYDEMQDMLFCPSCGNKFDCSNCHGNVDISECYD